MQKLLKYEEMADLLGISHNTLRNWVSARRVPYVKVGKLVRFDPAQVMEYINTHTVQPIGVGHERG